MQAMIWRILLAVFCCLVIYALLPPVFRVIGFSVTEDVMTILRICIGGLAALYIFFGPPIGPIKL